MTTPEKMELLSELIVVQAEALDLQVVKVFVGKSPTEPTTFPIMGVLNYNFNFVVTG